MAHAIEGDHSNGVTGMATTLTDVSNEDLLAELRSRPGLYLSAWTTEDALQAIADDEDEAVEDLDEGAKADLAEALLADAGEAMDDVLGQRGNDCLSDRWRANKDAILARVASGAPKP